MNAKDTFRKAFEIVKIEQCVLKFIVISHFCSFFLIPIKIRSQAILPIGYTYSLVLPKNTNGLPAISLSLYEDSTYYQYIIEMNGDQGIIYKLSMGQFKFLSDTLILHDTIAGLETRFLVVDSSLKAILPNFNFLLNNSGLIKSWLNIKLSSSYNKIDNENFDMYKNRFSKKENFSEIIFRKVNKNKFKNKDNVITLRDKKIVLKFFGQTFFTGHYNIDKERIIFSNNDLNQIHSFNYYYNKNGDLVVKYDWNYYAYLGLIGNNVYKN